LVEKISKILEDNIMNKANKKQILENTLSMPDIIKEFNSYKTDERKASFLMEMSTLNLPYKVDWKNLAECWLGNKAWPEKTKQDDDEDWWEKEKKTANEKLLSDYIEPIQGQDDKPLTKDEVESLI